MSKSFTHILQHISLMPFSSIVIKYLLSTYNYFSVFCSIKRLTSKRSKLFKYISQNTGLESFYLPILIFIKKLSLYTTYLSTFNHIKNFLIQNSTLFTYIPQTLHLCFSVLIFIITSIFMYTYQSILIYQKPSLSKLIIHIYSTNTSLMPCYLNLYQKTIFIYTYQSIFNLIKNLLILNSKLFTYIPQTPHLSCYLNLYQNTYLYTLLICLPLTI